MTARRSALGKSFGIAGLRQRYRAYPYQGCSRESQKASWGLHFDSSVRNRKCRPDRPGSHGRYPKVLRHLLLQIAHGEVKALNSSHHKYADSEYHREKNDKSGRFRRSAHRLSGHISHIRHTSVGTLCGRRSLKRFTTANFVSPLST